MVFWILFSRAGGIESNTVDTTRRRICKESHDHDDYKSIKRGGVGGGYTETGIADGILQFPYFSSQKNYYFCFF